MKTISSKMLAAVLAVLMLCALLPSAALAAEGDVTFTAGDLHEGNDTQCTTAPCNQTPSLKIEGGSWEQTANGITVKRTDGTGESTSWTFTVDKDATVQYIVLKSSGNHYPIAVNGTLKAEVAYTITNTLITNGKNTKNISHLSFYGLEAAETSDPDPVVPVNPADPTDPTEKVSQPSVDKDISKDEVTYEEDALTSAVAPGATVYFRLESNLPEGLENVIQDGKMIDGQTLTFKDTMSSNLTLNEETVAVKINDTTIENNENNTYYTVSNVTTNEDGSKTFTVTLNLTKLYNDDTIEQAAQVVVTYNATVSEDADTGDTFQNTAFVTYNNKDSVESTVTGEVEESENPPDSGGTGTALFTVGGLALMAVAGGLLLRRRQA